jgi:hypothetical protein
MADKRFNTVPQKNTIVSADRVILTDSEDGNKLKQVPATAFVWPAGPTGPQGIQWPTGPQGIQGDVWPTGPVWPAGWGDMLKSENLSGLTSYPTARSNLGLGNVDNTSDANKPVSTAQDAINILKADLVSGKVPASQLPSYVDDVLEFANIASFPWTGEVGKIYIALDTNKIYRWTGSVYIEITSGSAVWGSITGTLSSQTDLQNELNLKANLASPTFTGTVTLPSGQALIAPALGTPASGVATNLTGTATGLTSGITNALKSATTTVNVSSATAPTTGQVLTATSGTAATWQTPAGSTSNRVSVWTNSAQFSSATPNTFTSITFNQERFDTNSMHDNVTNNSRLVCQFVGTVTIRASVAYTSNTSGNVNRIRILKNWATVIALREHSDTWGGGGQSNCFELSMPDITTAVTDYYELQMASSANGNMNTFGTIDRINFELQT